MPLSMPLSSTSDMSEVTIDDWNCLQLDAQRLLSEHDGARLNSHESELFDLFAQSDENSEINCIEREVVDFLASLQQQEMPPSLQQQEMPPSPVSEEDLKYLDNL